MDYALRRRVHGLNVQKITVVGLMPDSGDWSIIKFPEPANKQISIRL